MLCIGPQLKAVNVSKVHGVDNNIQQTKLASPLFLYFPFRRCLLDSDFYLKYFPSKTNTRLLPEFKLIENEEAKSIEEHPRSLINF